MKKISKKQLKKILYDLDPTYCLIRSYKSHTTMHGLYILKESDNVESLWSEVEIRNTSENFDKENLLCEDSDWIDSIYSSHDKFLKLIEDFIEREVYLENQYMTDPYQIEAVKDLKRFSFFIEHGRVCITPWFGNYYIPNHK